MKFGQVTELEHAPWPVFRVDQCKRICGVNTAAADAAQWEELWNHPAPGPRKLKLIDQRNVEVKVTALVCRLCSNGQEQLLFQVLEPSIPAHVPEKGGSGNTTQAVAIDVAHKQKLDCALHLTRTVALDFNNALTTILGHASFVLEQMEPAHAWRMMVRALLKSSATVRVRWSA